MLFVNGNLAKTMNRSLRRNYTIEIDCTKTVANQKCKVGFLIEAMGHINYGYLQRTDRKGLLALVETQNSRRTNFA